METSKTLIVWKTSDSRAKLSEIWDQRILVGCTCHNVDLEMVNVILGSFGAFAIFRKLGLMTRDMRKH